MAIAAATATPAAIRSPISAAAFGSFLLLILFAQLDAVGNRISDGLPVSLYTLLYAATLGLAILSLFDLRGTRLSGVPATGTRLAAGFLLWAVVCWTLAEHRNEGRDYLVDMAAAMGLLFLAAAIVDSEERLRAAIWVMIGSGAVSALIVFGDYATGSRLVSTAPAAVTAEFDGFARSAGGSDQNPTTAAQMLMVSIGLMLGLLARGRSLRIVAAALLLLSLVALAIMSARSAVLGLAAMVGLVLLMMMRRRSFVVPAAILLGLVVVAAVAAPPVLVERFLALGDWSGDPTLFRRLSYLRAGADLFAGSPVWGVGPGNFPLYFAGEEYRYLPGREPVPRELHNTYADVAVELGIVGFILFAMLIVLALRAAAAAARKGNPLGWTGFAVLLALVGLLVGSFFMPHKDMRYLWLLLGLTLQAGRLAAARDGAT